ncbi:MAG: alpha/beta hydrolase, partial [Nocardioidaceae bacterium]|nr:alpha/beta hydrolase [Nocardioidaceae bacterium]
GRPTKVPAAVAVDDVRALVAATSFAGARHEFAGYRFTGSPGVPTTIAWGTRDVVLTHRTQSARARVALPQARHVDLPGCGHLPFSDDPGLCADVVLSS